MTGVAWFVNIFITRRIKNVKALRIGEVFVVLLVFVLFGGYIITWIVDDPKQTVSVNYTKLLQRKEDLNSKGCQCEEQVFHASNFMNYTLNDSDYPYCNGYFRNISGSAGNTICITSTYKFWSLINDNKWNISTINVLSLKQIETELINLIQTNVFDIWNIESDATWISELDVCDILVSYNLFDNGGDGGDMCYQLVTEKYNNFVAVSDHLSELSSHIRALITIDYDKYIDSCNPIHCTEQVPLSLLNMILNSIGTLGGQWAFLSGIVILIVTKIDDKFLTELVARTRKMFQKNGLTTSLPEEDFKILCATRPDVPLMYMFGELQEISKMLYPNGKDPAKLAFSRMESANDVTLSSHAVVSVAPTMELNKIEIDTLPHIINMEDGVTFH